MDTTQRSCRRQSSRIVVCLREATMSSQFVSVCIVAVVMAAISIAQPDGYGKSAPIPYSYDYSVKGDYKGPNFEQNEESDGKGVKGSYSVHLPDGRKQTVEYTVDGYSGFVAKVSYKGEAKHPSHYGAPVTFDHEGGGGGGYH